MPHAVAPYLRFIIHHHATGKARDLSGSILSFQQRDGMSLPFSSWVAAFKMRDPILLPEVWSAIEDDDWAEVRVGLNGKTGVTVPLQMGPIDGVRVNMEVDLQGTARRTLVVSGRGWGKALTDTSVTTWRRLQEMGWTGSVLTPSQAAKLDNILATTLRARPAAGLQQVLLFLLDGQWKYPASLAQVLGGGSEVFFDYLRPFVLASTGAEVDGVVWRGLSLMGGIRGTIWQVLSAFQTDAALVELWPGWRLMGRTHDRQEPTYLLPLLHYRRRPFFPETWASLDTYAIQADQIVASDLGKSGLERFNVEVVAPNIADGELELAVLAQNNGLPLSDFGAIRRHGTRLWVLQDNLPDPSEPDFLNTRSRRLSEFVWGAYYHAPEWANGTLTTAAVAHPPTVVGSRLTINDRTGQTELVEFYCEGVDSIFRVQERGLATFRQTFTVTRGRDLASAPAESQLPAPTPPEYDIATA